MQNNKTKILITGSNGYIGKNLCSYLERNGYQIFMIDLNTSNKPNYFSCDLIDKNKLAKIIDKIKPNVIVHLAALSSLKKCEDNPKLARSVNFIATKNLVDAIKKTKAKFIFLSSDYVFKGDKGKYTEKDIPNPQTIYGKTKLEGENYIRTNLKNYVILRTANVYGKDGGNFFNFIIESLENNQKIEVFDNVYFTPTFIDDLILAFKKIIKNNLTGIFHIVGTGKESRYSFAKKIATQFNKNLNLLIPSKLPDNELIAKDSSLDNSLAKEILDIDFLSVDEGLKRIEKYAENKTLSPKKR